MIIDLHTLILVLGITNLLQVIAILLQYWINRTTPGIGWWLLAFLSLAAGFVLSLLRDVMTLKLITIIAASTLTFSGPIFVYIGVMRYLGKKEQRGLVIGSYLAFFLLYFYFTYANDDINTRSVIGAVLIAFFSLLTAQRIFVLKPRSISTSANFLSAAWFIQGSFFSLRAVVLFTESPLKNLFTPTLIQTSTYLFTLIISLVVTFGLIIMVNQRLNGETREAKEHFELIFHTSPDAAMVTRLSDGVIVDANEGFTALSGYTRDETVGKSSLAINIYKNPEDRQKIVAELGRKGFCENYEALFQRKDGSLLNGVMSAKIFPLQDIPHIISITRDISERVRAEEQIRQTNAELEQRVAERTAHLEAANKDIASFTYSISHDLNIPVRAIAGFSQILLEEYHRQLDGEGQRLLGVIRQNTHKLDCLIKDMLALLRVSQNELKILPIDMTSLVQSVYLETASPEEQALFTFTVSALPETRGDPALMRLIWSNLISNAVKFTLPKE
jgi:PAS domain S-box-containing protein